MSVSSKFFHLNLIALSIGLFVGSSESLNAQTVSTTFKNSINKEVELFWIDDLGKPMSYGKIPPGGQKVQAMYPGNIWQIRQGSRILRQYPFPLIPSISSMNTGYKLT